MTSYFIRIFMIMCCIWIVSCKGRKTEPSEKDTLPVIKKDTAQQTGKTKPPPIINITDTIARKWTIIYVRDSAATSEGMSRKLAMIFRERLPEFAKQQKIQLTGPPIAWYKTNKPPFFFEAGLPVDKKPAKPGKNIFVKNIGGDSAVVAHFYGPHEFTSMGYEAVSDWLKSYRKKRSAPPYEIYIHNPFDPATKARDPYKVQTDIVFPRK